jgi:hypothetical protein
MAAQTRRTPGFKANYDETLCEINATFRGVRIKRR